MLVHRAADVVWTPLFGAAGNRVGVILAPDLALWCRTTTLLDRDRIVAWVWDLVRPRHVNLMPSDWIVFYENSVLPVAFYLRHQSSGKWLDCERADIADLDASTALCYSYHHTESFDESANLWLERAFSMYMTAMLSRKDF